MAQDLISAQVQNCINKYVAELGVKNCTTDISLATLPGDNYMGVVAKVQVKGEDKNNKSITLNFIVKSASQNKVYRSFLQIGPAYNREAYIYGTVLPEFTRLQEDKCIARPFKSFANYHGAVLDEMNEAITMQDMKPLGFTVCNRREPLDYNHVLLVLKEYGRLHALSYALRKQKPDVFEELSKNTQEAFLSAFKITKERKNTAKERITRALNTLDPVKHNVAHKQFESNIDDLFEHAHKAVRSEAAGKYGVIGHGDCWMNNLLFKYQNAATPRVPTELCIIDWQLSRLGSPALDLAYFLFTCTDKALRDQYYDHLIQEYYNSLSSFLRELGCDPEDLLPFEVLQDHLKKFSVFGLYMAIAVLFLMTSEVDEVPDFQSLTNEKDMMEKLKFKNENQNIETYNLRIRDVILDFVSFGYEF